MAEKQYIGWPWTDDGPVVSRSEAKRGRFGVFLQISQGEHPVRHTLGAGLKDAGFELNSLAVRFSLSARVQTLTPIFEPGIAVPPGEQGVSLTEDEKGRTVAVVNYFDLDEPNEIPDPLELRLRNG